MNRILKFFAFFCCSLFLAACGDSNTCQKEVNNWLQANAYEMYFNTETEMMEAKALSIPFVVCILALVPLLFKLFITVICTKISAGFWW